MNQNQKHLIVIAGPTAVGKTATAISIARAFNTSIISADSRQCYREMNIGTAKPSREELAMVHHYFINTHSLTQALSAADYEHLSLQYAAEIFKSKDVAVVCGGTGLYIKALCEGLDRMPAIDPAIEKAVVETYRKEGLAWLQATIAQEDPEFYAQAEQQNPHRLLRALIFKRSSGSSILLFRSRQKKERPFQIHKFALILPRPQLYERINKRVDQMMAEGLEEEVRQLWSFRDLKNMQTVGYAELILYLEGKLSYAQAVNLIKQHTRHYAKRQITWFKKDQDFEWLEPGDHGKIIDRISSLL